MSEPKLSTLWTITPNIRVSPTSLQDVAAEWIYRNHLAIKAHWTLKWTSDGTTGPSGPTDDFDRLTSAAACATRGTSAAAPQSWAVYENADGVQLLIAYQAPGTSPTGDDIIKHAYSQTGAYTLATPSTHQPTATDEVTTSGQTTIHATATADRVFSIWVRQDGKAWSCATMRSSAIVSVVGVERVTSLATVRLVNPLFDPPYVHYRYNSAGVIRSAGPGTVMGGVFSSAPTTQPSVQQIRAYTDIPRTILVGGGEIILTRGGNNSTTTGTSNVFAQAKPAAQNFVASPLLPIYWSGDPFNNTDRDGIWGSPIDWYAGYTNTVNSPALGDSFSGYDPTDVVGVDPVRGNWWISLGSAMIRPWRNAAPSMEIA